MPEEPKVGETPNPDPELPAEDDAEAQAVPAPHELGDENAQPV